MPTQEPTAWEMNSAQAKRKLQFLIDTNHVTVPQVANTIGVPVQTLQQVLDGAAHPSESPVRKCADYFGVTFEFITGQEVTAPEAAPPAHGRAKRSRDTKSTKASAATDPLDDGKSKGTLNVRTLATRHQALLELLIQKGLITAREYQDQVKIVEDRQR